MRLDRPESVCLRECHSPGERRRAASPPQRLTTTLMAASGLRGMFAFIVGNATTLVVQWHRSGIQQHYMHLFVERMSNVTPNLLGLPILTCKTVTPAYSFARIGLSSEHKPLRIATICFLRIFPVGFFGRRSICQTPPRSFLYPLTCSSMDC